MENRAQQRAQVVALAAALVMVTGAPAGAQTEGPPAPAQPTARRTPAPTATPAPEPARRRFSVEGFAQMGGAPKTDDFLYGKQFSGGGGFAYEVARNLQIRADAMAPYSWSDDTTRGGGSVCISIGSLRLCSTTAATRVTGELKNLPIFFGPRYFVGSRRARPYLEAGLGVNMLEFSTSSTRSSDVDKKTQVGFVPGAGFEVKVSKAVAVTAGARYHLVPEGIDDFEGVKPSFFGGNAGVAIRF